MHNDPDVTLRPILDRRIAVVGYGNQGRAQALNLRDSGCVVCIGARRDGPSLSRAMADGFEVRTVDEAVRWADVVSVLLPDQFHRDVFVDSIQQNLGANNLLLFAHGFSLHFGQIAPPPFIDVAMVAPVGPGSMVRRLYLEGSGVPALIAVAQDVSGEAERLALAYATALGSARVGLVHTTFQEETETDLFGEQAVLCGGLSSLVKAGFDTLVEAGYQPDIAYFECLHQIKLIADLMYEGGLASMHRRISDTAEFGDYSSGPRVIDGHVRQAMREVLADIQNGVFARSWMNEYMTGSPTLTAERDREEKDLIEITGRRLRSMMRRETNGRDKPAD